MKFIIGDRVCHKDGSVGYIEDVDDDPEFPCAYVRWLTPNNEPSVCVSLCMQESLIAVGDNVIPQPRNKEWWDRSREFCAMMEYALLGSGITGEEEG